VDEITKVELPLRAPSKLLNLYSTIGELKRAYPDLQVVKYIYRDPLDGALKGANPPDGLPLVANSYITVAGFLSKIIKFAEAATNQ
jgi:hypothetical protein